MNTPVDHRCGRMATARDPSMVVIVLLALFCLSGCAWTPYMAPHLDPNKVPVDAVASEVSGCQMVGVLVEDIDPEVLSLTAERVRCELNVRQQARQMGATHLVWIYRYPTGVAARVFRCPDP